MYQMLLFTDKQSSRIVNVASVPQRSPFRYPGGKTWLIPRIRQWFASLHVKPAECTEPFAGGASVSLAVAFEHLTDHVTMVEIDEQVAAVWQTILNGDATWLAQELGAFDLTEITVKHLLSRNDLTLREEALRTLVRNRVNRGGILAPGAGMLKEGENGKGLLSRWYPETLQKRILAIAAMREHFTFIAGNGLEILRQQSQREDVVFFIDPPYTAGDKKAGSRLYTYADLDHEQLFEISKTLRGHFLMTYDDDPHVRALARHHGFDMCVVAMKNTHHARMTELLIGRDLDWLRQEARHPL